MSWEQKADSSGRTWVEVLVDCPQADGVFVYRGLPGLPIQPGMVLQVPFGARQVGAIALGILEQLPEDLDPSRIRAISEVVSDCFFPPTYWTLLKRVSEYYCAELVQVVRVALPSGLLGRSQRRIRLRQGEQQGEESQLNETARQLLGHLQTQTQGDYSWDYLKRQVPHATHGLAELLKRGWVDSYMKPPSVPKPKQQQVVTLVVPDGMAREDLSSRQQDLLQVLQRQGGELGLQELLKATGASASVVQTLARKGYVVLQAREVLRSATGHPVQADVPKSLTEDQAHALQVLGSLDHFAQVLLHGVTGSGKTEVYLQAIAPLLAQGKSVLVLVPEIGLTPQLTDRFQARFGAKVCVYHSGLSDGERFDTWRQLAQGGPRVVIGTRSAVFAPVTALGLIVLDEEHDGSFKQDQPSPCYHARTVARWRAELENCPLVLGSATPSLESWVISQPLEVPTPPTEPNGKQSAYYLSLPRRVHGQELPPVSVVDMRQELQEGNRSLLSRRLQGELRGMLVRGEQGILFVPRRGHSTFVSCRSCGSVLACPHCDVSLTYHHPHPDAAQTLRCHYCNYGRSHPHQCPDCGSPYLKFFGCGTQRVVQELSQMLPELRWLRFDSDTTRTKGAHRKLLSQFANGEVDLLVGTQMLTKGIDVPQVTVVGVIAVDGLLHLPDFRASEYTFQTLTQVAGRAGRGDEPGQVILQTYTPDHPVIPSVCAHDYKAFVTTELPHRVGLNYPPYGQLILLRLSSLEETQVEKAALSVAEALGSTLGNGWEMLGPAPAQVYRVARRYRWQILLKFPKTQTYSLSTVKSALKVGRSRCPSGVRLTIDVDPLRVL